MFDCQILLTKDDTAFQCLQGMLLAWLEKSSPVHVVYCYRSSNRVAMHIIAGSQKLGRMSLLLVPETVLRYWTRPVWLILDKTSVAQHGSPA